jgi:PAS domain S-box-containing protein
MEKQNEALSQPDYKALFENVPGLYLILLPDFTSTAVSNSYAAATMTVREHIIGKNLFEVFPDNPDDKFADGESNLRYSLNTVLKTKQTHTMAVQKYDIRRPDGSFEVRWWSPVNKPVLTQNGEVQYIIHRVEDVTEYIRNQESWVKKDIQIEGLERKVSDMEMEIYARAQKIQQMNADLEKLVEERTAELMKTEQQFRHTLDNMLEGAQIIGFDWRYKYVNDALVKHSKYTREELVGFTVQEKYPGIENTPTYKFYERCFNERVPIHVENYFQFPDGSTGWFELSFQPIPEGIFVLSIDITERKKAEEQLRQLNLVLEDKIQQRTAELAAVNKELEAFSYSVSHDLRAPLRAVNGFSDMLVQKYGETLDPDAKRLLGVIKTNALSMGNLIDDLLAFSRTGRKEALLSLTDMQSLVYGAINELCQNEKAKTEIFTLTKLPPAQCDMQLMRQVWLNLISNAIKYSSKKQKPEVEIGATENDNEIIYYVKDNGAGFDMQYADKLFGVFQRLHSQKEFEGNGVGLALVQRIITKHGGRVWAEAELDKGATFYFTLKGSLITPI